VKKAAWSVLSQLPSSHVQSCIHTKYNSPPGEFSEIRMRLLEGSSTLYTRLTSLSVRVSGIRAKLVCLSITS